MKRMNKGVPGRSRVRSGLALLLAVLMCLPMLPAPVFAAEAGTEAGEDQSVETVWSEENTPVGSSRFTFTVPHAASVMTMADDGSVPPAYSGSITPEYPGGVYGGYQ